MITVWIFQATNKLNLTRENLDMAKKETPSGNVNLFWSQHKIRTLSKQELKSRIKIANGDYVVIEMKLSIIWISAKIE